jgi:glycosyltransferase involved in cell wall biosynthesis
MRPIRLSVVMTHPIQYYAPWFRHIVVNNPEIDLLVHYCVTPTPEQQGVGFDRAFTWDAGVLEGYRHVILRQPSKRVNIHSSSFLGVDVPEVVGSIRRAAPDVLLVPGWYSVSLVRALLAARVDRIPAIYRGDSQLAPSPPVHAMAKQLKTRTMLGLFTHFLTVGNRNTAFLQRYGIPAAKIFFSPHCVENEFFSRISDRVRVPGQRELRRRELSIAENAFVVLFVGKLEKKKRPWEVIRAAALLSRPVTVLMAGSGESEAYCQQVTREVRADVRFLGFRNQAEVAELYGVADCLVLPSDYNETWGMVVNEAMAAGLPCVVSDRVGSGPDLITDGETGKIARFGDVSSIAGALGRIRDACGAGHDFGPACRRRAAAYSFDAATEGLTRAIADATHNEDRC